MLAAPIDNLRRVRFPVMLSPKLDGMRVLITERGPVTRQLNPLPNQAMRERLSKPGLEGLDGELIAGDPVEPGVVQRSISAGMARAGRDDNLTYFAFDSFANPSAPFRERLAAAESAVMSADDPCITFLPYVEVRNLTELEAAEGTITNAGYEGVVLRRSDGPYVFGRVTAQSCIMLKHKRRIEPKV